MDLGGVVRPVLGVSTMVLGVEVLLAVVVVHPTKVDRVRVMGITVLEYRSMISESATEGPSSFGMETS